MLTAVMLSSTGALSMGAAGGLGVGAAREAGPASSAVSETAGGARDGGGRAGGQWFGSGGAHQQFDGDQHGERKVRPSSVGRDSMALRGESASWTWILCGYLQLSPADRRFPELRPTEAQ